MLALQSVSTGYGRDAVVRGIDLALHAGEIVALIGANGAGKSTLVKAVSGLLPLQSGALLLDGQPIQRESAAARVARGIAHVPEGRQIFAGMTVEENLRLGAYSWRGTLDDASLRARMDSVCARFPILLERLRHPVGNLSGGQQQMLAIARGLMSAPRFLLLDEPSLGLSPVLVSEIFRLIAGLRDQGLGILLSEQNARLSLAIADRAHVMENGRIALSGTGKELLGKPEVAARYLGVGQAVAADAVGNARVASRLRDILAS